jgi:hypothetical protein
MSEERKQRDPAQPSTRFDRKLRESAFSSKKIQLSKISLWTEAENIDLMHLNK